MKQFSSHIKEYGILITKFWAEQFVFVAVDDIKKCKFVEREILGER